MAASDYTRWPLLVCFMNFSENGYLLCEPKRPKLAEGVASGIAYMSWLAKQSKNLLLILNPGIIAMFQFISVLNSHTSKLLLFISVGFRVKWCIWKRGPQACQLFLLFSILASAKRTPVRDNKTYRQSSKRDIHIFLGSQQNRGSIHFVYHHESWQAFDFLKV